MADKIKAELLRPLNGAKIGSHAEYSKADFERLKARGAVKEVPAKTESKRKAAKAED